MRLVITEDACRLYVRTSPDSMEWARQLEGRRRWVKMGFLSFEPTPRNLELATSLEGVIVTDERWAESGPAVPPPGVAPYASRTPPYPHQEAALKQARNLNHLALFAEQGTGKTKILIDWAGELYCSGKITGVLVVSKKGVHRQWVESEIPAHSGIEPQALWWPFKEREWGRFDDRTGCQWLAFNYDGIKTERGLAYAKEFCNRHRKRLLIICDESQDIKNQRSQRHKALMALRDYASHRAIATGTPLAKSLEDVWSQFKWLDEKIIGIRYVTHFRNEYCIMGGFEGKQVIGHRNETKFKKLIDPHVFRATKADLGIIPKQYNTWHFDLTAGQLSRIKEIKHELMTWLDSGKEVTVANAISAMVKFQQVASGFLLDEEGDAHIVEPIRRNPRLKALLEWLEAGDGKAVIWFRFRHEAEQIAEATESLYKSVQYHGGISDRGRKDAIDQFMKGDAQLFIANAQTAGTGLNLQGVCNRALYFSNSFNAIDRWQSEDRIHRIGTKGLITYTDLIGKGSLDAYIIANLKRKKGLSDLVLDDIKQIVSEI